MADFVIRSVERRDLILLDKALRELSKDLGDKHPATIEFLERAGFGPTPAYHALIALDTNDALCGAVVFSPLLSTTLAATGLYVSDLWVAKEARRQGLGKRLLAHAAQVSFKKWGANYLKLVVYDESTDARRFYEQLGMNVRPGETIMFLDTSGFDDLTKCTQIPHQ